MPHTRTWALLRWYLGGQVLQLGHPGHGGSLRIVLGNSREATVLTKCGSGRQERALWHRQGTSPWCWVSWHPSHPRQQGPSTPGKHWKAALDKVGRGRAGLRAVQTNSQGQGKTDVAGADAAAPLVSTDIRFTIYRHQTGT